MPTNKVALNTLSPELVQELFGHEVEAAKGRIAAKAALLEKIASARSEHATLAGQVAPTLSAITKQQATVKAAQSELYALQNTQAGRVSRMQDLRSFLRQWQDELDQLEHPAPRGPVLRSAYSGSSGPAF